MARVEIRHHRIRTLKLKQQLADKKGFYGKERKQGAHRADRTEKEIAEKLDKLPDVLKDGYPGMCMHGNLLTVQGEAAVGAN